MGQTGLGVGARIGPQTETTGDLGTGHNIALTTPPHTRQSDVITMYNFSEGLKRNKTKYFRLRLTDEGSSERPKRDLRET